MFQKHVDELLTLASLVFGELSSDFIKFYASIQLGKCLFLLRVLFTKDVADIDTLG